MISTTSIVLKKEKPKQRPNIPPSDPTLKKNLTNVTMLCYFNENILQNQFNKSALL